MQWGSENPDIVIKSVAVGGKDWPDFDPEEGYVILPEGHDIKIEVTYASLK